MIAGLYDPGTAPICVPCRVFSRSIYRVGTLLGQAEVERASMVRNCEI